MHQVESEQTLQESRYREQQLELTNSSLQRHLERVTEEKEEREKEAVSCFNALEVNTPPCSDYTSSNSMLFSNQQNVRTSGSDMHCRSCRLYE